tara:strand:+ start:215 stop:514 length:300 start_codon:yes stop_codon:yes gene_type:complete
MRAFLLLFFVLFLVVAFVAQVYVALYISPANEPSKLLGFANGFFVVVSLISAVAFLRKQSNQIRKNLVLSVALLVMFPAITGYVGLLVKNNYRNTDIGF